MKVIIGREKAALEQPEEERKRSDLDSLGRVQCGFKHTQRLMHFHDAGRGHFDGILGRSVQDP